MNVKFQIIIAVVIGALVGGSVVWTYLLDKTGDAALAILDTEPERASQLALIAESHQEDKTEIARKMTFIALLSNYENLNRHIEETHLSDIQLRRYTEARERIKKYLLKYPFGGCKNIANIEEFGYCYDE